VGRRADGGGEGEIPSGFARGQVGGKPRSGIGDREIGFDIHEERIARGYQVVKCLKGKMVNEIEEWTAGGGGVEWFLRMHDGQGKQSQNPHH